MIIYDKRKPKTFDGANCVGITGENLAETQEFLIRGMCDITVDYFIHLRFADGSVNSVIPDSTAIDETGTKLVWKVKKTTFSCTAILNFSLKAEAKTAMFSKLRSSRFMQTRVFRLRTKSTLIRIQKR